MQNISAYGWMLWDGFFMTVLIAVTSFTIALFFGLIAAYAKLTRSKIINFIASCYTVIIRGIPEYVLLLILYFQGAQLLAFIISLWAEPQGFIEISPFMAGCLTLGFVYGAYATEAFRGGFQAIPKGQIEAAYACGMSRWLVGWRILIPQMWRFSLPALGNIWMVLLKSTAIVSLIGLEELARKSRIAAGATRDPLTFYSIAALIYLGLTAISILLIRYLEHKSHPDRRKGYN